MSVVSETLIGLCFMNSVVVLLERMSEPSVGSYKLGKVTSCLALGKHEVRAIALGCLTRYVVTLVSADIVFT